MTDSHPLDKTLSESIEKLMDALDWKEDRYKESCCADEIIALVNEGKEMLVRYDEGEIHFDMP